MKKLLPLLLALLMLPTALAESAFDLAELRRTQDAFTYEEPGTVDTVVRMMNQPYMGELDDGELYIYVDYVHMPDHEATFLRLMVSITVFERLQADQVAITVGGKRYSFAMACSQSEYDGVYMEDYTACMTDASLAFIKALAQQKKDEPLKVEFISLGEVERTGRIILPGQDMADLYDRYIDLGGKKQNLKALDTRWPCTIEQVK